VIEATNLRKHFGKVAAIRDVSLRAPDGRITGLLGPNGAGKSTTLRVLYTVLKTAIPVTRSSTASARSASPSKVRKRIRAFYPTGPASIQTSRRGENILYFGALHGMSRTDREARAERVDRASRDGGFPPIGSQKGFSQGQRV